MASVAGDVQLESFLKADASVDHGKNKNLANLFWKQWLDQYFPLLQRRQKWFETSRNLQPGNFVSMEDKSVPQVQ